MKFTDVLGFGLFLLLLAAFWVFLTQVNPKDDTDPPSGRSGMTLHTDNLTGCQYLGRTFGGITPRVDGKGQHVGCKGGGV